MRRKRSDSTVHQKGGPDELLLSHGPRRLENKIPFNRIKLRNNASLKMSMKLGNYKVNCNSYTCMITFSSSYFLVLDLIQLDLVYRNHYRADALEACNLQPVQM